MALQGTLETFALPDVLRLLASTHKTGRLRLTGANGSGSLWLDGGAIVSSEAARAPLADGPTDVLFELLRFKEGDFVFDDDATVDASGSPTEVEDALAAAEAMLEEWKSIEAVVPSLAAWVSLRPELPDDDVTVDAAHWRQLVAVGGGITVAGLGDQLGLAELPISRAVKDLVELGLVELERRRRPRSIRVPHRWPRPRWPSPPSSMPVRPSPSTRGPPPPRPRC